MRWCAARCASAWCASTWCTGTCRHAACRHDSGRHRPVCYHATQQAQACALLALAPFGFEVRWGQRWVQTTGLTLAFVLTDDGQVAKDAMDLVPFPLPASTNALCDHLRFHIRHHGQVQEE
eukprot:CAMPEP_0177247952 /NCGR_PEP_ID=MMETSP0367-20130122/51883_1 /TAXON_ID=447022 ORGANISM="Scrippsiella hangoei-like, Strain SHHI-4" /NCGR_SAMPLE_ID=MMETSP0367 /ASSEMBLY_ACC=CAM_ASM_000362 /LENGTH=120 /DNA_ID=CAMNT_0018700205 /DNA_START=588 /DNA_END=951 /DNA_ORIENTATION=-